MWFLCKLFWHDFESKIISRETWMRKPFNIDYIFKRKCKKCWKIEFYDFICGTFKEFKYFPEIDKNILTHYNV